MSVSQAERFFQLFLGYDGAYGTYRLTGQRDERGKALGQATTLREPPTLAMVEDHLAGGVGIGLVPIRPDGTCRWAALDIDEYDLDLAALARTVREMRLPMACCTTKSRGMHLYMFFHDGVPAALAQRRLREISQVLGHPKCEVFPKQTSIDPSRNDVGNWINLPYYDCLDNETLRVCLMADDQGEIHELSFSEFLDRADQLHISEDQLQRLRVGKPKHASENKKKKPFADGPPCLQTLTAGGGIGAGQRNNGMFNILIYLRRRYGDTWKEYSEDYNSQFIDPPLEDRELLTLVDSVDGKEYRYRCNDEPICSVCDSRKCATRKYGVGDAENSLAVTLRCLRSEPVIWFVNVEGHEGTLELATEDLLNYQRFTNACVEQMMWPPPQMKQQTWYELLRLDWMPNAVVIELTPEQRYEASAEGRFWALTREFVTEVGSRAQEFTEISLQRVVHLDGYRWFQISALREFLRGKGMGPQEIKPNQITKYLREAQDAGDAEHKNVTVVEGQQRSVWGLSEEWVLQHSGQ